MLDMLDLHIFTPLCVIIGADDDGGFDDERRVSGDSGCDYHGDGTDPAAAAKGEL